MIDSYVENRGTGSFIIVDPTTNFRRAQGRLPKCSARSRPGWKRSEAERCGAPGARGAAGASDDEAVEAVRKALEEILN